MKKFIMKVCTFLVVFGLWLFCADKVDKEFDVLKDLGKPCLLSFLSIIGFFIFALFLGIMFLRWVYSCGNKSKKLEKKEEAEE